VQLFDNKGSVVRQWQKELLRGDNQFAVDMQDLSTGIYYLFITWGDGKGQKGTKILKQ